MSDMSRESVCPQKGSPKEWRNFSEIGTNSAVGRISSEWFSDVSALVRKQIFHDTAAPEVLEGVQLYNPDSFWGLFKRIGAVHELIGVYGQLLLNPRGHDALLNGALDRLNPAFAYLAKFGERPAAVYIWCVVAKKRGAMLQAALMKQLQDQHGMPYYASLATQDSFRIGKQIGFQPVKPTDDRIGGLFKLPDTLPVLRSALAERPVTTKVVETAAEFSHVFALRAATFVAEQDCPINEEFDGNDFSAQHIVAYVGDAPAAAIRVRYFHSFAKWERFCILPRFRKSSVRDEILSAAEEIVRRKGFNQIYFQAEAGLGAFWERRGFRRRGERVVRFSGREYGEFIKAIAASTNAITLEDDPLVLNRVEGKWHKPGILDRSSERLGA